MRGLYLVNYVTAFLVILEALAVQGCLQTDSKDSGSGSATKAQSVNQAVTPSNPTPTASTCGHSKYYFDTDSPGTGIVNGVQARQNEYPWIARLSISWSGGVAQCAGSVISKDYVITAAHCIYETDPISNITLYFGDHDKRTNDTGEISIMASSWAMHSSYDWRNHDYDFALIKLSTNLTFTTSWAIQPICLPDNCLSACVTPGSTVYIAGWGTTSEGGATARYLQRAYVSIADWTTCQDQHSDLTNRMICAGYAEGGVDSCQGDSGGPLMSNEDGYFKLCGVTSYGNGCARANSFGVYSNVCKVLPWIKTAAGII